MSDTPSEAELLALWPRNKSLKLDIQPRSYGAEQRAQALELAAKLNAGVRMQVGNMMTDFYAELSIPVGMIMVYAPLEYKGQPAFIVTLEGVEPDWVPPWEISRAADVKKLVEDGIIRMESSEPKAEPFVIDETHLRRQAAFSAKTFGPGQRTKGVIDHIRKELTELEEVDGDDVSEWADVIILGFDGALRRDFNPRQVLDAILAKQTKNEAREWPDWRTADPDKAIEHVRQSGEPVKLSSAQQDLYDLQRERYARIGQEETEGEDG